MYNLPSCNTFSNYFIPKLGIDTKHLSCTRVVQVCQAVLHGKRITGELSQFLHRVASKLCYKRVECPRFDSTLFVGEKNRSEGTRASKLEKRGTRKYCCRCSPAAGCCVRRLRCRMCMPKPCCLIRGDYLKHAGYHGPFPVSLSRGAWRRAAHRWLVRMTWTNIVQQWTFWWRRTVEKLRQ